MLVRLNGELRELPDATTVAGLLRLLCVKPARVAVLVNEAVVVRARHEEHAIAPGDAVEIVALIAGA
jgi:thiamine biosynthesis protein ThiS